MLDIELWVLDAKGEREGKAGMGKKLLFERAGELP